MRNLKIGKRRVEIKLNSNLYPQIAVEKALMDFGEVFSATIDKVDENLLLTLNLNSKKVSIEEATYNFLNYLLAEIKNEIGKV